MTEECLNTLKANREPIKWDTYYAENGMDVSVQNMSFEVYDDNVYSFTASLEIASDDTKEVSERTGQITVLEEDGKEKVSHIYVNP